MSRNDRDKRRSMDAMDYAEQAQASSLEISHLKLKKEHQLFDPEAKTYGLMVLPYDVVEDHGPVNPKVKKGDFYFTRKYAAHRGVGDHRGWFVCPRRSRGEKCPVCEQREKLQTDPRHKDAAKALKPSDREIWQWYDLDRFKAGVQIYDVSTYFMEGLAAAISKGARRQEDIDKRRRFANPDDGMNLIIGFNEDSFTPADGKKSIDFMKPATFGFEERDPLTDKDLESAYCLDDLVWHRTYDELHELMWGSSDNRSGDRGRRDEDDRSSREDSRRDDSPRRETRTRDDDRGREQERGRDDDRGRNRDREEPRREERGRDRDPEPKREERSRRNEPREYAKGKFKEGDSVEFTYRRKEMVGTVSNDDVAKDNLVPVKVDSRADPYYLDAEDLKIAAKPTSTKELPDRVKTAEDCGLRKFDIVLCKIDRKELEVEITDISSDGTRLTVLDDTGKTFKDISPEECTLKKKEEPRREEPRREERSRDDDRSPAERARGREEPRREESQDRGGRGRSDDLAPFDERPRESSRREDNDRGRGRDDASEPAPSTRRRRD